MIETANIKQEQHKRLKDALSAVKQYGYKSYVSDTLNITWAYVITPSGNLLTIGFDHYGGFDITFDYQPHNHQGSRCTCKERDTDVNPTELTREILAEYEQRGCQFALQCGATFYASPEEGLKRQFHFPQMYEL